jgi:uncharacterized protein HemX
MNLRKSQAGIGHVVAVLLVVVVAGVAFAGYTVYKAGQKTDDNQAATTASSSDTLPTTIKTKADLTATSNYLDNTATELNSNLDPSSLDSDIDQLL